jgi:TonB-dependent receptor
MRFLLCSALVVCSLGAFSQNSLRGHISDIETGESMVGVVITLLDDPMKGTRSDLDGNYSIDIDKSGQTSFVFRFASFKTDTIAIDLTAGVTVFDYQMKPEGYVLEGIEIIAKANTASKNYLTAMQMKSATVLDGTTSDQMKRMGDGDAASAAKRVVGVSLVGNFVFVRGLSDRYSQIVLNGAVVPSLDPRRNSIQLDVFPTNALDNLMISKTFAPNLTGSFTGGLVDVRTKDFPEKFNFQYSIGVGYNPNVTFNSNFLSTERGNLDFIGVDDGFRAVPEIVSSSLPVPEIYFSNYYDAIVLGGFESDLAAIGINSVDDIGSGADQMTINEIISASSTDNITSLTQVNALLQSARETGNTELSNMAKSFENTWDPVKRKAPLNMSQNISFGNQGKIGKKVFGYNFGLTYAKKYDFYEDGVTGRYKLTGTSEEVNTLNTDQLFSDSRGDETNLLSALLNTSLKINDSNKVGLVFMRTQIGNNASRYQTGINPSDQVGLGQEQRTINYNERVINVAQLKGEHLFLDFHNLRVSWIGSYTFGHQYTPDLRVFINSFEELPAATFYYDADGNDITDDALALLADGENLSEYYPGFYTEQSEGGELEYSIRNNLYPSPTRYYREMDETLLDTHVDFELPIKSKQELENKLMFGLGRVYSDRKLDEQRYSFISSGVSYNGNPAEYFIPSNMNVVPGGTNTYIYLREDTELQNSYTAHQQVLAGYAMTDYNFNKRFRAIVGVRFEKTDMLLESKKLQDALFDEELRKEFEGKLNEFDILPSINLNYQLSQENGKTTNIRAGYNRTLARPSFLEKAPFSTFDFETQTQLTGNPDLKIVNIDNYDLRFEHFPGPGEIYSVGAFYKDFQNPIELVTNPNAANIELTWENVEKSVVYGLEMEVKKSLWKKEDGTSGPMFAGVNFSYIVSRTTIIDEELEQIRATDPTHKEYRPLLGQAPYMLNAFVSFATDSTGWNFNVAYNLQGPKLFLVTKGGTPDIYEQPVGMLDFTASKTFKKKFIVGIQAKNLLDAEIKRYYEFKDQKYDWQTYKMGPLFQLNLTYKI